MRIALRQSFSAKVSAVGFILFILFGNFLLLHQILATPAALWIQTGFTLSLLLVALGGIGLAIQSFLLSRIEASKKSETDHDDGNPAI